MEGSPRLRLAASDGLKGRPALHALHSPQVDGGFRAILLLLLLLPFFGFAAGALAQEPVFFDEFEDDTIDAARWKVTQPYAVLPPSTARETNGSLELFRRGIVDAQTPLPVAIDLEGRFRFTGESDTLSIVFRSDLTVTNDFARRGVQAALQQNVGRVFLIPEPHATAPIAGSYVIGRDTNVTFRVTDNGSVVRLYLQDFLQPVVTAVVTNRRGNRLSIYNLNGTTSRVRLDRIAVYPLLTSVFLDDQLIRTNLVQKSVPSRVRLQSVHTNGSIFYTLDGSTPTFVSTEYTGSFTLSNSATIRAVAYPPDFLSSTESIAVTFQYLPIVRLTNETRGGGIIVFAPTGPYVSNQLVSLTALPAPGWQFLRWEGAASGASASNQITLTNHLAVRAVFGTTPVLSIIGFGQVETIPPGPVLEYGTPVRLTAVPNPGQYFVRWANAVTGAVSPVTLTVTNAAPGVSALFFELGPSQASLTVRVEGGGAVTLAPPANVFTNGQQVTLTGVPDAEQILLGWTGAVTGQSNPVSLTIHGSTNVTARFAPAVRFNPAALQFGSNGLRLSLNGVPGFVFNLEHSSNFTRWERVATLTNVTGELLYQHPGATQRLRSFYRVVGP